MQQPAWLERAWAELGTTEGPGNQDNPRVVAYYRDAGHPGVEHDAVAWCAAFVGAVLARSGQQSTRSLMARSYLQFGEPVENFRLGAVAVLTRGNDPALGHVGFLVGESGETVYLLGGNQSDAVTVSAFERSRLLALRWPVEAPVTAAPSSAGGDAGFDEALAHVLQMEGGWTEDPYDPGGPTNQGVTLAVYARHIGETLDAASTARLKARLRAISPSTVREIYDTRYWQPSRAPDLPAGLALMHFDASVNHGVAGAARFLQQAVGADVDGEIGPLTLAAAHAVDEPPALNTYAELRRTRYRALHHFWRFGRGWLRRVDSTLQRALARVVAPKGLAPQSTVSTPAKEGSKPMSDSEIWIPDTTAKWWGESLTIWGVVVTTLATVLPVVGPLFGLDLTAELVHQLGEQATQVIQALGGLVGTLMTIVGRTRAVAPLVRREMIVKV